MTMLETLATVVRDARLLPGCTLSPKVSDTDRRIAHAVLVALQSEFADPVVKAAIQTAPDGQ